MLALGAGILYGLQDGLTQRMLATLRHGFAALLLNWPVFAVAAVAVMALLVGQSAFEAAPLPASLPAMTVGEPITAIAFGAGVYGAHLNHGWPLLAPELMGLAAMTVGVRLIARSPLISRAVVSEGHRQAEAA